MMMVARFCSVVAFATATFGLATYGDAIATAVVGP
jgi:hypothetical protein